MRKYGKLLLVLAVLAAVPSVASADGLLSGLRQQPAAADATSSSQNQQHAEQVKNALKQARIKGRDIRIEVVDGVVQLSGQVTVPGHRSRAAEACQQIPGISHVENKLQYLQAEQQTASSDTAVQQSAVQNSGGQQTLMQRVVQLRGRQQTPAAQPVVQNSSQSQPAAAQSNQQVAEQIGGALYQAGLQGYDIVINYKNGVATLSGPVGNPAQMAAAEAATSRVPGVQRVVNQLQAPQTIAGRPQPQMAPASFARQAAPAGFRQQAPPVPPQAGMPHPQAGPGGPMMQASASSPMAMAGAGHMSHPNLPSHAWPAYAQYPNSAAVSYPTQYSASAFPYIGPFYPYPQVPLGWRDVRLQWDDGFWHLNFNKQPNVWDTLYSFGGNK